MRGLLLFVSGAVVALLIQTAIAQNHNPGVIQLNHVGIAVSDMDESLAFYTETMGFEEVFRVTNDEGEAGLVYLRVSESTFLELQPANENRPAGRMKVAARVRVKPAGAPPRRFCRTLWTRRMSESNSLNTRPTRCKARLWLISSRLSCGI